MLQELFVLTHNSLHKLGHFVSWLYGFRIYKELRAHPRYHCLFACEPIIWGQKSLVSESVQYLQVLSDPSLISWLWWAVNGIQVYKVNPVCNINILVYSAISILCQMYRWERFSPTRWLSFQYSFLVWWGCTCQLLVLMFGHMTSYSETLSYIYVL